MKLRCPGVVGLVAIVAASFGVRVVAASLRATPDLFPDEYTYAELGRSLSETGRPLVRGASSHFPALLQPLVTAPAWLVGDVEVGYRLVQGIGAFAMSLAAIPAYLLARRLRLGTGLSLGVAGLAVLAPDLVYTSYIASEPIAYPLVLCAVLVGVAALARPRARTQLFFVGLAGLCTFARVQFLALPFVFLLATVLLGLAERKVWTRLRGQALPLLVMLGAVAAVVLGRSVLLGNYDGGASSAAAFDPVSTLRWASLDAMTLAYASGWLLVPGALIGLWLAFRSPGTVEERALAAFTLPLTGALLLEAGLVQSGVKTIDSIEERYVFYLIPLLGLFFALYARRGWPHRIAHLALAAGLVLVSVRIPLSGYVVGYGASDSPLLSAVAWLSYRVGETSSATLAIAALATLLSVVVVACSRSPRIGTPVALAAALGAMAAASIGAVAANARSSSAAREALLPANPSWVDHQALGHVALLQASGGDKWNAHEALFWNRTVDQVLLLPGASRFDAFAVDEARPAEDGTLLVGGKPYTGALLVDTFGSSIQLRGATRVGSSQALELWKPDAGHPRLALYAVGRGHDGWLSTVGSVYVWPAVAGGRVAGRLMLDVQVPAGYDRPMTLTFEGAAHSITRVRIEPGARRSIEVPICANGSTYVTFRSSERSFLGRRMVSVQSSAPRFVPDESACPVIVTPVHAGAAGPTI